MEESITSDLTDVGHSRRCDIGTSSPRRCDIGTSHSSNYPRRIVPDDDSNAALEEDEEETDFDNFDDEEEDDNRRDDDDYNPDSANPDSANSRRKSSRLRDKVKEQIPLELRRDHMTVIRVFSLNLKIWLRFECMLC